VGTGFSRDAILGCVLKPIGAKALSYIALSPWPVLFLLGVARSALVSSVVKFILKQSYAS